MLNFLTLSDSLTPGLQCALPVLLPPNTMLRASSLAAALLLAHCAIAPPSQPKNKRWVSYWYSPAHPADDKEPSHNVSATLALLKQEGGSKIATSLMLYCEDKILPDGSFQPGVSVGCDAMIPQLTTMGIGSER